MFTAYREVIWCGGLDRRKYFELCAQCGDLLGTGFKVVFGSGGMVRNEGDFLLTFPNVITIANIHVHVQYSLHVVTNAHKKTDTCTCKPEGISRLLFPSPLTSDLCTAVQQVWQTRPSSDSWPLWHWLGQSCLSCSGCQTYT